MRFGQVLDALKEGKILRRPGSPKDDALRLRAPWSMEKGYEPVVIDGFGRDAFLKMKDLFADDWEVV